MCIMCMLESNEPQKQDVQGCKRVEFQLGSMAPFEPSLSTYLFIYLFIEGIVGIRGENKCANIL